jgi:hypothetical protein
MSRLIASFFTAFGMWLGGSLAVVAAPLALAAVALGAFGLLSTVFAAAVRIGSQPTDQTVNAAEPSLSRAQGSAASSNRSWR